MTPAEKEAIKNLKENLEDFPEVLVLPHVLRKDVEILVRLVEKAEKERQS